MKHHYYGNIYKKNKRGNNYLGKKVGKYFKALGGKHTFTVL